MQREPSAVRKRDQVAGFLIVLLTMVEMFTIPRAYFVLGSIVSTTSMICVASFLLERTKLLVRTNLKNLTLAAITAIVLYLVFFLGNSGIRAFPLFGMSPAAEQGIYGLFNNVPLPLLVIILLLDSIGFESYFRGNLIQIFSKRLGIVSILVSAGTDALIHLSTLNPLFPATTFVADCFWGLYYFRTKDLPSTIACHFIWDALIFIVIPIH